MRLKADLKVNEDDLEEFQEIIGFRFNDKTYLVQALTHGSLFSGDKEKLDIFKQVNCLDYKDYEKLEYLGDAVLGLVVAEYAFNDSSIDEYTVTENKTIEGVATRIKVVLTSNESLKPVAHRIRLADYVLCESSVNIENKLSDIIEALLGAIYVDSQDYSTSRDFIYKFFDIDEALEKLSSLNPKGKLQEMLMKSGHPNPVYEVLAEEGPDHDKNFTVGLFINGKQVSDGQGKRKSDAEKSAATEFLEKYEFNV